MVIGSPSLQAELERKYANEKTSLGEPINVVLVDKSDGAASRSETFIQHEREAVIKEYFFGDARRTLSPQNQQVDFDSIVIYKAPDCTEPPFQPSPSFLPLCFSLLLSFLFKMYAYGLF